MVVGHFCGQCNTELVIIYDSRIDSGANAVFSYPEGFAIMDKEEQQEIKDRHEYLKKTLDELTKNKRDKILIAVEKGLPIILLLCSNCKKVYDSRILSNDSGEKGHTTSNIPIRKPKSKIVSDDLESIQSEMDSEFEGVWNNQQSIYVYSDSLADQFYENKQSISKSMFAKREQQEHNNQLVTRAIRQVNDDENKEIVDISYH